MAVIEYQWLPEPVVIADDYGALAIEWENRMAPMEESLQVVINDVQGQFESGGPGWAPWAEATANDPRANELMMRSGDLLAGATSEGSYEVTKDFILWTGADAPPYWRWHWTGTYKMPSRSWIGMTPQAEDEVVAVFESWMGRL